MEIKIFEVKSKKMYRVCGGMSREEFVNFTLPSNINGGKSKLDFLLQQLEKSMGKELTFSWSGGGSGEVIVDGYTVGYCSSVIALMRLFEQLVTGANLFKTIGR